VRAKTDRDYRAKPGLARQAWRLEPFHGHQSWTKSPQKHRMKHQMIKANRFDLKRINISKR
jgi:hypothetical protein